MRSALSPGQMRKRARLRSQAITYLVGGVLAAVFLTLYLAPKAQAQRQLEREARRVGAVAPTDPARDGAGAAAALPVPVAATPADAAAAAGGPDAGAGSTAPATAAPAPAAGSAEVPGAAAPAIATAEPAAAAPAAAPPEADAPAPPAAEPAPVPPPVLITRFSTGSAILSPPQLAQVERAAAVLLRDPMLTAEVRGHADMRGSESENTPLSEQRANAVAVALRARGVDRERLQPRGAGSHDPVDEAANAAAFARNRRVEIVFIRKESP